MAQAAPHPCGKPGCRVVLARGIRYCQEHQRAVYQRIDRDRGTTAERGYAGSWPRLRSAYLQEHPLCVMCMERGVLKAATVVDHIVPIAQAPERRLDETNLRSLCKLHHDQHTARTQGFAGLKRGGRE